MKYIHTLILAFLLTGISSAQQIYTADQINSLGDFESYNSFSISFPPFTTYDGDGQNEYELNGISWPNGDVPQAFMVFNPQNTTPAMAERWLHPRSGSKLLKASCNWNTNANNWFITPKVQLHGGHPYVSFWVYTYHTFYQRIRVLVSTTTNDVNSFELVSPGDYLEAPIVESTQYLGPHGWKKMKFDLSKYANNAIYIAINQVTPSDGIMVAIDDFFIADGESGANIPIVNFTSDSQQIDEGGSISFTNQTQNPVTQYQWKFAGGTPETSTVLNPTVSYANEGTYMVSLTATNSYGTDTETKYSFIKVNGNNALKPLAQFTSEQHQVMINTEVAFQDASANSPTAWNWEFPGGSPGNSTDQNPQVSYPYPGNYDVLLTAINEYGQTTRMKTSYIQVGDENGFVPVAKFSADNNIIYAGESINFTDLSTNSPNSWSWSFEGGTPAYSTAQNPTVSYLRQGTYAVSLIATNATGSNTLTEKGYITVIENTNTHYCVAGVNQITSTYYINNASFGSYTNNSSLGADGYADYSAAISASFNAGDVIPFSATASTTWTSKLYAYIDWNEDFDFNDPDEFVFLDSIIPYTDNIVVPQGVEPGEKRLRIRLSLYGAPASCGNLQYGETEDYTIKINGTKDFTAPTAPSNLMSTDITETTIGLSWNASTDENGVAAYFIYADDEIIGTSSGLSFIAQSLLPNTNYNFYVKASDAVGNISDKSNTIMVKTNSIGDNEAPTAPQNLSYSNLGINNVDLSWTASTDNVGVVGYDIYQGTSVVQTVTTTNASITGLTANTTYSFSVKAKDAAGNTSAASNVLNVTTLDNSDDGGQLTDGVVSTGNMDLSDDADMWYIEVGPNAKSMRVLLGTGRNDFDTYGKFNAQPTTSSYDWRGYTSGGEDNTVSNPPAGRHYIMVKHYAGSGPYSLTATIVYNTDTQAPSAPTNLTSSNITQTSVDLSWTASTDNVGVTAYDVYQGTSLVQTVTTTSANITGLLAGTNYTFSVEAIDAAGNVSPSSNRLNITTQIENISYCDATHSNPLSYFYIKNVSFGSINNSTTLGNATSGYSDYTSQSTSVSIGDSYNLSVDWTPAWSTNSAKVYIDWNHDGDFDDANETVMDVLGASIPYSVNVVVPSNAVAGNTRMRVKLTYNSSISPCEALYWGETEDYTINVSASTMGLNFAENAMFDVHIFPNPTSEVLNIWLKGANSAKIQLINVSGQIIKKVNLTSNRDEIDISGLQKGLYMIKIFSNNKVVLKKVLIE